MDDFIIKFYQNNSLIASVPIESDSLSRAVTIAIKMVEDQYWNRIKVERL
jgi:hypothetical protein